MATGTSGPIPLDSLPPMSASSVRIVGLCDKADVEVSELAEALAHDPAMSARILSLANSAAFGRGRSSTTIDRSIMMMGINAAKLTALGFVVSSSFADISGVSKPVLRGVWRDCLVEAVAAREFATLARLNCVPEAFLCGLFDGTGKLLGALTQPETYGELITTSQWPDADCERDCLGATRTEIVRQALQVWGVPALFTSVLEATEQNDGTFAQTEVGRLAAVVALARHAAQLLTGHTHTSTQTEAARQMLGLQDDSLDVITSNFGQHVVDLADALDVEIESDTNYPQLLEKARSQIVLASMELAEEAITQSNRIDSLESLNESLQHEVKTDRLTHLANRAHFDDELARLVDDRISGRTTEGHLGVAMIDVDHFKSFNDTYGHQAGDHALTAVGAALAESRTPTCLVARYGGEEFVLVAHRLASQEELETIVERIRSRIENTEIDTGDRLVSVTASIGAAITSTILEPTDGSRLVDAADHLLYQAKHHGRNRCYTKHI